MKPSTEVMCGGLVRSREAVWGGLYRIAVKSRMAVLCSGLEGVEAEKRHDGN